MIDRDEDDPLSRGSREHYDDAVYYEQAYRARRADVAFYRRLARRIGGPVLDLGGGSGRVAIPIADDGAEVTVIDASQSMLDRGLARAATKLSQPARRRLRFLHGDVRTFALGRRFPLVIAPFNVLMHLYEPDEFRACFDCVRKHLSRDGRLVFDMRMPLPNELARNPDRVYKGRPFRHPTLGHRVEYTEQFRYDAIKQVQHVTMRFAPAVGSPKGARSRVTLLTQRQVFPNEMRALLALGGLRMTARWGDFTGRALRDDDVVMILEARTAKDASPRA